MAASPPAGGRDGAGRLAWPEALKCLALLAVLLNHVVEEFGPGPWFTNPSRGWPDLATRLRTIFPAGDNLAVSLVRFAGWLGDSGPGVFILVSGFGLAWGALRQAPPTTGDFLRRRVLRIFPLYVAAHFCILAGAILVPGTELSLASPRVLLSLAGLRFTESLFFFLSPSWWFVWLILQLYLVFPALLVLLRRAGVARFLVVTWAFTFACRALGLLGWIPTGSLYQWMTGLFFGTRLAEFTAGMALAALLRDRPTPGAGRVFAGALPVYLLGLGASFTWPGTIVSNLLVTLGLSGLFFAVAESTLSRIGRLRPIVLWVGAQSYGVYLLHQPPLHWTASALAAGGAWPRFLACLLVVIAGFPAAAVLSRAVERIEAALRRPEDESILRWASRLAIVAVAGLLLLEPAAVDSSRRHAALALLVGAGAAVLLMRELSERRVDGVAERLLRWAGLASAGLALFVLPQGLGPTTLAIGVVAGLLAALAQARIGRGARSWTAAAAATGVLLVATECALVRWAPLEAGRWGEYPALTAHPTRVYGLVPDRETHLRYNNYDYWVRTNSLGLPGPEVTAQRPTPDTLRLLVVGDAFTMPEGVDYARSYPSLLQDRLAECLAPRRVEVIDAGVTGYGPVEETAQVRELVPVLRPDLVVYEFFINEFSEALLTPEARRADIGFPGPGASSRRERLQIAAHAREVQSALWERLTGRPAAWRYEKALLRFYRAAPNPVYSAKSLDAVRAALETMDGVARREGAGLLVVFVPGAVAVSKPADVAYFPRGEDLHDAKAYDVDQPLRQLQALARPIEVPVLDLTPDLRGDPHQPVYFPESWHWNEEGHRVAADAIARGLALGGRVPERCGGAGR